MHFWIEGLLFIPFRFFRRVTPLGVGATAPFYQYQFVIGKWTKSPLIHPYQTYQFSIILCT